MSSRPWNSKEYKEWRISVYKRDNFTCRWPNCNCKKKLNAHHIMPWSQSPALRFNIRNGITLCKKHHKIITGKESYYAEFLSKILERTKLKRKRHGF